MSYKLKPGMTIAERSTFKLTHNGEHLKGIKIVGKNMTRDDIKEEAHNLAMAHAKTKPNEKYYYQVSVQYPNHYYPGDLFTANETPSIFSSSDTYDGKEIPEENEFQSFWMFFYKAPSSAGGSDEEHNDCLHKCIKTLYHCGLPKSLFNPVTFKKTLGVSRDDLVDVKHIPTIEKILKDYAINVNGDAVYTSKRKCKFVMNLKLANNHYTIDYANSSNHLFDAFPVSYKERKPLMQDKDYETVYDGETKWVMTTTERRDVKFFKTDYILIPYLDEHKPKAKQRPVEECFDEWKMLADELKRESKGSINLYKSGSLINAVISLFSYNSLNIAPEPLSTTEAAWIDKAFINGIMYSEAFEGGLHKYDFVSRYPSTLESVGFKFPIAQGEFANVDDIDVKTVAIYRCIITPAFDDYKKVFRLNPSHYYTNVDVRNALSLGFTVELIHDDQANALIWTNDKCATGSQVFKKCVDKLFSLKKRNVTGAKQMLSVLWGSLCKRKWNKRKSNGDIVNTEKGDIVQKIIPSMDGEAVTLMCSNVNEKLFVTNYARIAPFLTATARYKLSQVVYKIKDKVKRCYIDSIYSEVPLDDKECSIGEELGDLRYEGYCKDALVYSTVNKAVLGTFE